MNKIYLIKSFDKRTWIQYFPVAFRTKEEAERYCVVNEKIDKDHGIIYSYAEVHLGKMGKCDTAGN